ncbi:hypothetical protein D3C73_1511110 [compost metagenome]
MLKVQDNKAVKVEVKKGRETDDRIEVFGDLAEGDKLVAEPTEEMHEGMAIKP